MKSLADKLICHPGNRFIHTVWVGWSNAPEVNVLHSGAYLPCEDMGQVVKLSTIAVVKGGGPKLNRS